MDPICNVKISCDGDIHEQISRRERLHFVVGHIMGSIGTTQFINSLHDHKGCLMANISGRHQGIESAIEEAWAAAGETYVEFTFEKPMEPERWDRCATCDARVFCDYRAV
jgi:hypothetical protein